MSKAMDEIMGIIPHSKNIKDNKNKFEKEDDTDEMVGHSTNRKLNEKYNIKIRIDAENFDDTFKFLRELGYNTLFRFDRKGIKIFKLDPSATHFSYVVIDKTEMSEYYVDWKNTPPTIINDDTNNNTNNQSENEEENYQDENEEHDSETPNEQTEKFPEDLPENQEQYQQLKQQSTPLEQQSTPLEQQSTPLEQQSTPSEQDEIVVYLETDIIEDIAINTKYPVEMYFDTIEKNKYYIVNGKEIVSRRLEGLENNNNTVSMYSTYYKKMMRWMTDDNTFKISVTSTGIKNVLTSLEKKKPKKDTKSSAFVEVKFNKNEIDFIVQNEIKSSSIQLYGDDIIIKSKQETEAVYNLESLIKFSKLKLSDSVKFYINESFPLVLETRYGANKFKIFYVTAPRGDAQ